MCVGHCGYRKKKHTMWREGGGSLLIRSTLPPLKSDTLVAGLVWGGVCHFDYVHSAKSHDSLLVLSSQFYSLYWQGFEHPVSFPMPSISMLAISYFSLVYSLRGEEKARILKLYVIPELCVHCAIV